MPVITVNDQPHALKPGENRLGGGHEADIHIGSYPALGVLAIIEVGDGPPVIRRATAGAVVRVNGVALVDPTPLVHGDKVQIWGRDLLYSDDANSGATRVIAASEIAAIASQPSKPAPSRAARENATIAPPASKPGVVTTVSSEVAAPSPARAPRSTSSTGARLVSLVDGKEYSVGPAGLTIGRDAASAVVVAQDDVSRNHALLIPVDGGYEIRDVSVNGIKVNGVRVDVTRSLAQSDVIQIGTEEFRFHSDAVRATSAQSGSSALRSFLGAPASDASPALAVLRISGSRPSPGREFQIRVPLATIGRGAHNDVSIDDASISDSHAKLHYRDRAWFITDLASRNGSYVGGVRFSGERRLYGNVELRVGNVKMMFRPTGALPPTPKETPAVAGTPQSTLVPTSAAAQLAATTPSTQPQQGPPAWMWGVVVVAMVAVAALFLLNR